MKVHLGSFEPTPVESASARQSAHMDVDGHSGSTVKVYSAKIALVSSHTCLTKSPGFRVIANDGSLSEESLGIGATWVALLVCHL